LDSFPLDVSGPPAPPTSPTANRWRSTSSRVLWMPFLWRDERVVLVQSILAFLRLWVSSCSSARRWRHDSSLQTARKCWDRPTDRTISSFRPSNYLPLPFILMSSAVEILAILSRDQPANGWTGRRTFGNHEQHFLFWPNQRWPTTTYYLHHLYQY